MALLACLDSERITPTCQGKEQADSMSEYKTDQSRYTPRDFVIWEQNQLLVLTPKFQRRSVWRTPARSFLIDTILREMTVPPIYLRLRHDEERNKTVREVVDGQQRILSVLGFIKDEFRLATTLPASWSGKKFSQLTDEEQTRVLDYSFSAEIFKGISDQRVLEVFCRLNMNGVPLNKQELRNGRFFGLFKQTSYKVALDYLQFWRLHRIFSELAIARMLEVELVSELLIASHLGMQDKKDGINQFYEDHEEKYAERDRDEKRFRETMETLSDTFDKGQLSDSAFRRVPLFYTLYCVVFHHTFSLPGAQRPSPKKRLSVDQRERLRDAVVQLSEVVLQSKDDTYKVPKRLTSFVNACQQQTDNIGPRKVRFTSLYDEAFK